MPVFLEKAMGAIGLVALFALVVFPVPALAQSPARTQADPPTIRVDPAACRYLTRHQPGADVEYRPGVDVHGRPVAPADLPDSAAIALPEVIEIELTADLARRFGIATNNLYRGEVQIGTVTVERDRVLFNGRPVQPAAEADLVALCANVPH
ncbi:hypothetical protein [Niveispirillum fermenti]|uniref:hypothetical protein n=1 Tax=Niveispirillum fermenti TaxID=1233113 RepID=UPI003A874D96